MANPVSSLLVRIGADTSGLEAGGRRASKSMEDLGTKAADLGKKLATIGAAAAAAGAAMAVSLVKNAAEAAREIDNLSRVAGASAQEFQRNAYAARLAGIQTEKLADIYKDVNDKVGEFVTTGGGPLKDFFEQIAPRVGVTAEQFRNLSGPQALQLYYDSLERANVSQSQMTFYMEAIASDATKLAPLLRDGGDAMKSLGDEAERLGVVMSQIEINQLVAAQAQMTRVAEAVKGIGNQIAIALSPYVAEVAKLLGDVTANAGGFREQIQQAVEASISELGKLADAVHVARIGFAGFQLVAAGVSSVFWSVIEVMIKFNNFLNEKFYGAINQGIALVNRFKDEGSQIPPITIDTTALDNLAGVGETARQRVVQLRDELVSLTSQEWPSTAVDEFLANVRARAQEAAEAVAGVTSGSTGGSGFDPKAEKAKFEEEIALLQEQYKIRSDIEAKAKAASDAILQDLERQHMDTMASIRGQGLSAIDKFTYDSFKNQVKTVSSHLADITANVAHENKAMFNLNKVAGIANAIVSAYEGIALTMSKYPYPINIGMAAAHAAAAFAQVNAIKSATFGGGGGTAPSLAGGTPATPVTPVTGGTPQAPERSVLVVEGISQDSLFSGRAVREIAERLQEHIRDGGTVQFA